MPLYRDKRGRFSSYDKRKYLYDIKTNKLVSSPTRRKPEPVQYVAVEKRPITARGGAERFIEQITLSDRTKDTDLYKYLAEKGINKKIQELQKKHPKKVLTAIVDIQLGERKFTTREFKLTDLKTDGNFFTDLEGNIVRFKGGKRKGRLYTAKDSIAYFIHDMINITDYTLYRRTTDTNQLVKKKGRKAKYDKKQTFKINIRAVPKRTAKKLPNVAGFPCSKKRIR